MIIMKVATERARAVGRPLSFNRAAVLEKAMLTFWRHGYETTSISDLTLAMGVTAPSIYSSFGDKKRLFLEAMHLYAGSPEDLSLKLGAAPTAFEAVHQMLMFAADAFTRPNMPRGCLLASATASCSLEAQDVQKVVTKVRCRIMKCVRLRIEQDVTEGILPQDTQAAALATLVITLIQGMSVLARDGASRESLKAMLTVGMGAWPKTRPHV